MKRNTLVAAYVVATLTTALVTVACATAPEATLVRATNALTPAQEVPPNGSSGSGVIVATLDKEKLLLTWTITYSGMSGPVTAGHFHGPAGVGANAGVVLPFTSTLDSPIEGSATLTGAQLADLLAGKWYVNLHTAGNPGGEIRGQLNGISALRGLINTLR